MKRYENHCVGCASSLGCDPTCRLNHLPVYYCDKCGDQIEEGHYMSTDGEKDLCLECFLQEHMPTCDDCGKEIDGQAYVDGGSVYCKDCLCKIYEIQ